MNINNLNKKTLISSLQDNPTSTASELNSLKKLRDYELFELYINPDYNFQQRDIILDELKKRDDLLCVELINNICRSFMINPSRHLRNILIQNISNKYISFFLKVEIIDCIYNTKRFKDLDEIIEKYINIIIELINRINSDFNGELAKGDVSIVFIWDVYTKLLVLESKKIELNEKDSINWLHDITFIANKILKDNSIELEFRYKLLQNVCNNDKILISYKTQLLKIMYTIDFTNSKNVRMYIYLGQLLLKYNSLSQQDLEKIEQTINTKELTYNEKADIGDFLLSLTSNQEIDYSYWNKVGKEIIEQLSYTKGEEKTIYNNQQNVHYIKVDESVEIFLEKLLDNTEERKNKLIQDYLSLQKNKDNEDMNSIKTNANELIISDIKNKLFNFGISTNSNTNYIKEDELKQIDISLKRILLDNKLYSNKSISLFSLFLSMYIYILDSESKNELLKRLIQELIEMNSTCSEGHFLRLINVFSGYELTLKMSIEDELKSCIFARLQYIISNKSEKRTEDIYNCIGDPTAIKNAIEKKESSEEINEDLLIKEEDVSIAFDIILGADIKKIYEELNKEYVGQGLIDEQTFDIYCRRNIMLFQLGEKI